MPVTATHFHNESRTQNHSYVANKETMCFHISLLEIIYLIFTMSSADRQTDAQTHPSES